MKKILIMSAILFMGFSTTFAQLQLENGGMTQSISELQKNRCDIHWCNDGYYYEILDYTCSKYNLEGDKFNIKLYLGQNETEVKQSADILQQWFENASNEEYVYTTNKNGQKVCLYKYNANLYISYGSEQNCKQVRLQFGSDATAAIGGIFSGEANTNKTKEERDRLLSNIEFGDYMLTTACSFKKGFMRSVQNFLNNNNSKNSNIAIQDTRDSVTIRHQELKTKVTLHTNDIYVKYKEYGLSNTPLCQQWKHISSLLSNSKEDEDLLTLEKINKVMESLCNRKAKQNREAIEKELTGKDTQEQILIFLKYSTEVL